MQGQNEVHKVRLFNQQSKSIGGVNYEKDYRICNAFGSAGHRWQCYLR
jgi:hypothetical protein